MQNHPNAAPTPKAPQSALPPEGLSFRLNGDVKVWGHAKRHGLYSEGEPGRLRIDLLPGQHCEHRVPHWTFADWGPRFWVLDMELLGVMSSGTGMVAEILCDHWIDSRRGQDGRSTEILRLPVGKAGWVDMQRFSLDFGGLVVRELRGVA